MKDLRAFRFKDITVMSPDDISESIAKVDSVHDARSLIVKIANHITIEDTNSIHLRHACKIVSKIGSGYNIFISKAIVELW